MNVQSSTELAAFYEFVGGKVNNGETMLTPEEVLDQWRLEHPEPGLTAEEIADIEEALADMANGDRGIPFEEFDRDFRARHGLPAKS
jgi:hypothetical protein